MTINIGDTVEAVRMPGDSFYLQIRGTVVALRNGWATVQASEVKDRWSREWAKHPTFCAASCRVEDLQTCALEG